MPKQPDLNRKKAASAAFFRVLFLAWLCACGGFDVRLVDAFFAQQDPNLVVWLSANGEPVADALFVELDLEDSRKA